MWYASLDSFNTFHQYMPRKTFHKTSTLVYYDNKKCTTNATLTSEVIYLLNLAESTAFAGVIVSMLSSWKDITPTDSSNAYYKTSLNTVFYYLSSYHLRLPRTNSQHCSRTAILYYHTGYRKYPIWTLISFHGLENFWSWNCRRQQKRFVALSDPVGRYELWLLLSWLNRSEIYDPCHSVYCMFV